MFNDQTTRIPVFAGLLQTSVTTGSHEPLSAVIQILISAIRHQRQCLLERRPYQEEIELLSRYHYIVSPSDQPLLNIHS